MAHVHRCLAAATDALCTGVRASNIGGVAIYATADEYGSPAAVAVYSSSSHIRIRSVLIYAAIDKGSDASISRDAPSHRVVPNGRVPVNLAINKGGCTAVDYHPATSVDVLIGVDVALSEVARAAHDRDASAARR